MSAGDVRKILRRVHSSVDSGDVFPIDPHGARLLLRALLFDGAGVPSWHALAACTGMPWALFFPGDEADCHDRIQAAKKVCGACPVQRECLDDAMAWELSSARVGVRGGLSAAERQRLAVERTTSGVAA